MTRKHMSLSYARQIVRSKRRHLPRRPEAPLDARAEHLTINSAALGVSKHFHLYTPPTYHNNRQRLPVLYLFRGHENEWINPHQDGSRQGRTVIDVYEELLQVG